MKGGGSVPALRCEGNYLEESMMLCYVFCG